MSSQRPVLDAAWRTATVGILGTPYSFLHRPTFSPRLLPLEYAAQRCFKLATKACTSQRSPALLRDVMGEARRAHSCDSCHAATLWRRNPKVKNYVWCPLNSAHRSLSARARSSEKGMNRASPPGAAPRARTSCRPAPPGPT